METKVASTTLSEQEIQNIYDYAVMLIGNGQSNAEVSSMMISRGIASADSLVITVSIRQQIAQSKVDMANKNIRNGALWCVGGLLVTGISYAAVSEGGGSYMMCWGAVIFGGIQFFRGLAASGGANKELADATQPEIGAVSNESNSWNS